MTVSNRVCLELAVVVLFPRRLRMITCITYTNWYERFAGRLI